MLAHRLRIQQTSGALIVNHAIKVSERIAQVHRHLLLPFSLPEHLASYSLRIHHGFNSVDRLRKGQSSDAERSGIRLAIVSIRHKPIDPKAHTRPRVVLKYLYGIWFGGAGGGCKEAGFGLCRRATYCPTTAGQFGAEGIRRFLRGQLHRRRQLPWSVPPRSDYFRSGRIRRRCAIRAGLDRRPRSAATDPSARPARTPPADVFLTELRKRRFAALVGADPDDLVELDHHDLAVADFAGVGGLLNRVHGNL